MSLIQWGDGTERRMLFLIPSYDGTHLLQGHHPQTYQGIKFLLRPWAGEFDERSHRVMGPVGGETANHAHLGLVALPDGLLLHQGEQLVEENLEGMGGCELRIIDHKIEMDASAMGGGLNIPGILKPPKIQIFCNLGGIRLPLMGINIDAQKQTAVFMGAGVVIGGLVPQVASQMPFRQFDEGLVGLAGPGTFELVLGHPRSAIAGVPAVVIAMDVLVEEAGVAAQMGFIEDAS